MNRKMKRRGADLAERFNSTFEALTLLRRKNGLVSGHDLPLIVQRFPGTFSNVNCMVSSAAFAGVVLANSRSWPATHLAGSSLIALGLVASLLTASSRRSSSRNC